ncbi:MAG: hypothetical protein WC728_10950 [Elusimicrobiota bacterium]
MSDTAQTIWTALVTSVGGTGALLAVAFFAGKKWLSTRIEESVKLECSKELEKYKVDLQEQVKGTTAEAESDKKLFQELLKTLPSLGVIEFLRQYPLGAAFTSKWIEPLREYESTWHVPEKHFLDVELKSQQQALYKAIAALTTLISKYCYASDRNPDRMSISFGGEKDPVKLEAIGKELDTAAILVVEQHDKLVELARKKLKC